MKSPFINQNQTPFERYKRQLDLPEIGLSGQKKLAGSSVFVIGAGGLGAPLLTALAGAGVGRIGICESDHVEYSNLNRQFFYTPGQLGQSKLQLALAFLRQYQPETEWIGYDQAFSAETAGEVILSYDLVLAAVDNRKTRWMLNQAACETGRPFIDAGIKGWDGYVLFVNPGHTACYACFCGGCDPAASASKDSNSREFQARELRAREIHTREAQNKDLQARELHAEELHAKEIHAIDKDAGMNHMNKESQKIRAEKKPSVLGATASLVGSLQGQLALRWLLLGNSEMPEDLLLYNGRASQIDKVKLKRMPGCPICGNL